MKKTLKKEFKILFLIFLFALFFVGCSKPNEKTNEEMFFDKYISVHPEGYEAPEQWYKYDLESLTVNDETGEKTVESVNIIGLMKFMNHAPYVHANKASFTYVKTIFKNDEVIKKIKEECLINEGNAYKKITTIDYVNNTETVETIGGENVEYASFYLEFHNGMFSEPSLVYYFYKEQASDKYDSNRFYDNISVVDEKYLRLSSVRTIDVYGHKNSYITEFWFDNDYEIKTILQSYSVSDSYNAISGYCETKTSSIQTVEPIDIVVPTEYDKKDTGEGYTWDFLEPYKK